VTAPGAAAALPASRGGRDGRADEVVAGKYALIEPIGEGGMGAVWRARQTEPIRRYAGVKLIKAGMDSRQVLARFEAERQALALMDHPNIARVPDGGLHDGGPFFVMKLVKGVPITDYCDARRLTPRERLELLVPVWQAIQRAHQKGVINRDIKPSNLVCEEPLLAAEGAKENRHVRGTSALDRAMSLHRRGKLDEASKLVTRPPRR
jgi:serine/threonine protein kinase